MTHRVNPRLSILVVLAVVAAVTACTTTPVASPGSSGPALSLQDHIAATKAGLDEALTTYKAGDKAKAEQLVGDAYEDHFEDVEGPLGQVDMAFMEGLEDLIRADIRNACKDGKPVADIEAMVNDAKARLDEAAQKLQ
jgi:hypothetical protein